MGDLLVRSAFQTSDQPGTFQCSRLRYKTCPFICKFEKISGAKRSIKVADHFTCTSANVIYCTTCTLCKNLYNGETGRRLGEQFREHLRNAEKGDKNASKPVVRHLNLLSHFKQYMAVYAESPKSLEQKFIFQIGNLSPHDSNERFSFNLFIRSVVFHVTMHKPIAQLHFSVYKPHVIHNSPIRTDKG